MKTYIKIWIIAAMSLTAYMAFASAGFALEQGSSRSGFPVDELKVMSETTVLGQNNLPWENVCIQYCK